MELPRLRPIPSESMHRFECEVGVNTIAEWNRIVEMQPEELRHYALAVFKQVMAFYNSTQTAAALRILSRLLSKDLKNMRERLHIGSALTFGDFVKLCCLTNTLPCTFKMRESGSNYVLPSIVVQTVTSRILRGDRSYEKLNLDALAKGLETGPVLSDAGIAQAFSFTSGPQTESLETVQNLSTVTEELTDDAIAVNPHEKPAFLSHSET